MKPSRSMTWCGWALAAACALAPAALAPAALAPAARAQPAPETKRIFAVAPLRWNPEMTTFRPAQPQTPSDLANLTGGIVFGMSPTEVNGRLPEPAASVSYSSLPVASEFSDEARYFWVRLDGARDLRAGVAGCVGANSYVAFLFRSKGLFRISYRLLPDPSCPSVAAAAADIFARYVKLALGVAVTTHYRTGPAEVVELNDPAASYLIPTRLLMRGQ